jgi:AraC-like DNA-binding protein
LPFIAVLIEHAVNIFSLPVIDKIYIDKTELFKSWIIYPIIVNAVAVFTLGYLIWGWILIRKYNRYIQNYFSETNQINLQWLRILLISTAICYALNDFTYILDLIFHFAPYKVLQLASFMIASFFILVLGFFGLRQGNIFTAYQVEIDLKKTIIPSNNEKIKKEDELFVNALITYMKENKPFLNPELTIAALSRELNVSPYYLSDILNNKLNLNFYDFINHYRVEEFKMKLTNPESEKLSFSGIASDCGFNSKATFYRVFKKSTGTSPNEYYKAFSRN